MKVTGSDITKDKSKIELTALNLLCLARLQEMLTKGPEGRHPFPAHLFPSHLGSSPTPFNRKMYSCDYEGCGKVGNIILLIYLNTLEMVRNKGNRFSGSSLDALFKFYKCQHFVNMPPKQLIFFLFSGLHQKFSPEGPQKVTHRRETLQLQLGRM